MRVWSIKTIIFGLDPGRVFDKRIEEVFIFEDNKETTSEA
jgi:hypothetical protein